MVTFIPGRLAPHPEETHPRLKLGHFLTGTYPAAPPTVDYVSSVTAWPMYANDEWGDCVWAMIGHSIQAITCYGRGVTVTVSEADVLKGYSDVTGFDPNAGPPNSNPTDQGTNIQDALGYWRKTGVGGHKIVAFAQVDVRNPAEVDAALYLFGHLQLGINFPASAMDQFNAGRPWDAVAGAAIEGGHAVDLGFVFGEPPALVGRSANGEDWDVITWAKRQRMTQSFWDTYVEEAWIVISEEWISAQGTAPQGLDIAAFNAAFTEMTGQPGPLPVPPKPVPPSPTPPPGPTPEPPPAPSPGPGLLEELATLIREVASDAERGIQHIVSWLAERGL